LRVHEAAKLIGTTAKALMPELEKQGFQYKTHMAVLEEKALLYLQGKYPQLKEKMEAPEPPAEEKEKKPKAVKHGKSKVVTQRTVTKKAASVEPEKTRSPGDVEIVQRPEGSAGTVTLEQRVVGGGVLRRRRVETPIAPPPPPPAEPPASVEPEATPVETAEEAPVEEPILEEIASEQPEEVIQPPEVIQEEVSVPPPVVPSPTPVSITPPSTGRNLSSPTRLRIVDQPPIPPRRPISSQPKAPTSGAKPPVKPSTTTTAKPAGAADEAKDKEAFAAKKRVVTPRVEEAPHKLTKKDLLGMMEEVEITRPFSRKSKRPQKVERKVTQITTPGQSKRKIRIENDITVADLADRMGVKAADVIRKLISMGQMATIHQRLDFETASLIAGEYNYEVQNVAETAEQLLSADRGEVEGASEHRAPIVTVMGHVDHGKTSLLDFIRKARVAAGEAGGITQHIGAYQVEVNSKKITFIDTPGHAAFTAMRARGASLTDIVILVVAADEGVKPQTLEALAHAQAAKVPVIVAINKIDKPEANPERVTQELSGHGLVPEAWGGDTMYMNVSAHTGQGIPELLESVLLQAEVKEFKADPNRLAKGVVIESRLDKGKGPVASAIIQTGTLNVGSFIVSGTTFGKVRALFDDQGRLIKSAGPSIPVEILGFDAVPNVGDILTGVSEDSVARKASELASLAQKKADSLKTSRMSLEDMYQKMQAGDISELRVVLKADVQGSMEAIADSLLKIKHDKVKVDILFKAVGAISESDVDLASASGAIIFGFNVRPTAQAKQIAQRQGVQIKSYEIIYELIDEVKKAMQGLLAPITKENVLGQAEVREVFTVSKVGPIAGSIVKSGKIVRNAQGRLIRDNVVIYTAKIASLRRFKDDAREVSEGLECGIRLENFTDIKAGDVIECFENIEIAQAVG
jgi:translation initiation factor IF-2